MGRSQGGLPGGGCALKENRIGTGMAFYKQTRKLGYQAGGEAGTQVGKDRGLGPDRECGGKGVAPAWEYRGRERFRRGCRAQCGQGERLGKPHPEELSMVWGEIVKWSRMLKGEPRKPACKGGEGDRRGSREGSTERETEGGAETEREPARPGASLGRGQRERRWQSR